MLLSPRREEGSEQMSGRSPMEDEGVIESPMKGSLNNEKHLHGLQGQTALSSNLAVLCNLDKLLKPSKVEFSHLLNGANSSYCRVGGRIKWDRTYNPPAQSEYSTSRHQYGLLINGPTLIYSLSNYFTCDFFGGLQFWFSPLPR